MYCKNCGSQIIQDAKFCKNCGMTVVVENAYLPVTQPTQNVETTQHIPVAPQFTGATGNYPTPQMQNYNNNPMDAETVKEQAVKFSRARAAIISVFAFTAINLILSAIDAGFYFVYSAYVPHIAYYILEFDYGIGVGLFATLAMAAVFLVCWALSKRWRAFILVAMLLFIVDALVRILVGITLFMDGDGDIWLLVETAISVWIIIQLAVGTAAWRKLNRFSPEQIKAVQDEITKEENVEEIRTAMNEIAPAQPTQENNLYQNVPPQQNDTTYADNPYQTIPHNQINVPYANDSSGSDEPGIQIDDNFKTQVLNIFKGNGKVDNVYLFEGIPEGLLRNAIASFAPTMSNDEIPIILYDDTVGNSGKKGVLLTTKKLYSIEGIAPITSIEKITKPSGGIFTPELNIEMAMRSDIGIHLAILKKPGNSLFELISQTVTLLKERQAT